jgi:hypothetical protein
MKKQDIALKKTAELWNAFMDIPLTEVHSDDTNDFRHHLHALQNILYAQLYKNQDPVFKVEFHSSDLRIWTNNLIANGTASDVNSNVKTF